MLSEKRLLANKQNAQRSTGPRTEAGKRRARGNSWRHGLTSAGVVATRQFHQALEAQRAEFEAHVRPESAQEQALVEQIALASARMEHCQDIELARLEYGQKQAARRFAKRLQMRRRLAIAAFRKDAVRGLSRLREISTGCLWLVAQWDELAGALQSRGCWDAEEFAHALRLCGIAPGALNEHSALHGDLIAQHALARERALKDSSVPPNDLHEPASGRAALLEVIAHNVDELSERAEDLWQELEEPERAEELERAAVDVSPAGMLLARYELASEMTFHRSFKELRRSRAERAEWPAAVFPSPAPAPVRNEPNAEPLTREPEATCAIVPEWQNAHLEPAHGPTPPRRVVEDPPQSHWNPARAAPEVAAACLVLA